MRSNRFVRVLKIAAIAVDARTVRLAYDQFLASAGSAGVEPDFLRRIPRARGVRRPTDDGALGTDDARTERAVHKGYAGRALREV